MSSAFLMEWFRKYRKMNQQKITHLSRLVQFCQKFMEKDDGTATEIFKIESSMWGFSEDLEQKKLKGLYDILSTDAPRVIDTSQELIKILNEEIAELNKYLKNLTSEEIETLKGMEYLLSIYNEKKDNLTNILHSIVGEFIKIGQEYYGVAELSVKKSKESFADYYHDFENYLATENADKGAIFWKLYTCVGYLKQYLEREVSVHELKKRSFLNQFSKDRNAKRFVRNFFDIGKEITLELEEKAKSFSGDKSYASLDKDDQLGLDKFLKKWLKQLYIGVEKIKDSDGTEKEIKKVIDKLVKLPSDFKDEKKIFEERYAALVENKFSKLSFNDRKSPEHLEFICDGLEEKISFKKFKSDMLKEEHLDIIKNANLYLLTLIESKDDKPPYSELVGNNSTIVKSKENKVPSDFGDGEVNFNIAQSLYEDDVFEGIVGNFDSLELDLLDMDSCIKLVHSLVGDVEYSKDEVSSHLLEVISYAESKTKRGRDKDNAIVKEFSSYSLGVFDDNVRNNLTFWKDFFKKLVKVFPEFK